MSIPRSIYDKEGGLVHFPRMLDKIRLHQKGELPEDYESLMGGGFDSRVCNFLRVDYAEVVKRVEEGLSDAEVLAWCYDNGRRLSDEDILIFNSFMIKRGWRDDEEPEVAERLKVRMAESGLSERKDIVTFFDYLEADEGRL